MEPPSLLPTGAAPPDETPNFPFSPEEGFEGYGEASSEEELVIEDKVCLSLDFLYLFYLSPKLWFYSGNLLSILFIIVHVSSYLLSRA